MDVLFSGEYLSPARTVFLIVALFIALGFEVVNGFHDTANAVATVIYTRSLRPWPAVIWSGICNFLGVHLGGIAVAYSIVRLLPVDLLVSIGTRSGLAMVMALLVAAIVWNLATWYRGLPASSSHTLIGAILGVGLANSLLRGQPIGAGVNWAKAGDVGLSLLLSPLVGLTFATVVLLLAKRLIPAKYLYEPPAPDSKPPLWVRALLIVTCSGVSFAHGSNDGQKGIGLIMLILIGLLPAHHSLNLNYTGDQLRRTAAVVSRMEESVPAGSPDQADLRKRLGEVRVLLEGKSSLAEIPESSRWQLRTDVLEIDSDLSKLEKSGVAPDPALLKQARKELRGMTEYAPDWVVLAVALCLGVGTTIGWKRIVVTVGEKIGKTHLTYGQGAAAELVAMTTIGMADKMGMPVSTTQVLSSAVAGTMAANRSGLQLDTVKEIALAWVLTLPTAMALGGGLFLLFRLILGAG